jgi:WD40 repeat protein
VVELLSFHGDRIYALEIAPRGNFLAVSDWRPSVVIYSLDSSGKHPSIALKRATTDVSSVAFDRQERVYFSGCGDSICCWELAKRSWTQPLSAPDRSKSPGSIAVHPLRDILASACHDGISLWDYATSSYLHHTETSNNLHVKWSIDGRWLISYGGGGLVSCWICENGQTLTLGQELVPTTRTVEPIELTCTHEGGRLFTGHGDGSILLWDIEKGRQIAAAQGHSASGGGISFLTHHPRIPRMVSGGNDFQLKLWDTEKLQILATIEFPRVWEKYQVDATAGSFSRIDNRLVFAEEWLDETRGPSIDREDTDFPGGRRTSLLRTCTIEDLLGGWEYPAHEVERWLMDGPQTSS